MEGKRATPEENSREVQTVKLMENPITRKILNEKNAKIESMQQCIDRLCETMFEIKNNLTSQRDYYTDSIWDEANICLINPIVQKYTGAKK